MKKIILLSLLCTGCVPVPIVPKFPDPVPKLMEKCKDLIQIEGNQIPITDFLKTIVQNYTLYYECSSKVDGWQDWYEKQKKIYDKAKS